MERYFVVSLGVIVVACASPTNPKSPKSQSRNVDPGCLRQNVIHLTSDLLTPMANTSAIPTPLVAQWHGKSIASPKASLFSTFCRANLRRNPPFRVLVAAIWPFLPFRPLAETSRRIFVAQVPLAAAESLFSSTSGGNTRGYDPIHIPLVTPLLLHCCCCCSCLRAPGD